MNKELPEKINALMDELQEAGVATIMGTVERNGAIRTFMALTVDDLINMIPVVIMRASTAEEAPCPEAILFWIVDKTYRRIIGEELNNLEGEEPDETSPN